MNRIEEKMTALKNEGRKAFITYTTAGLPDMETTKKIMFAQQEAGIDVMELGIPFSDPVADGPVIQAASYEAIQKGATLTKIFTLMKEVRKEGLTTPVVFMMYYNTVYHYGLEEFVEMCAECGVDGLIIPDLPYEEQKEINAVLAENEAAPILIQLVSPVSKQRIPMIVNNARGFVYCVSSLGVTGMRSEIKTDIKSIVEMIRKYTDIPIAVGFGISKPEQAEAMARVSDGAIVGSAIVKIVAEHGEHADLALFDYVQSMKQAVLKAGA